MKPRPRFKLAQLRAKFDAVGYLGLDKHERTAFKRMTGYVNPKAPRRPFIGEELSKQVEADGYLSLDVSQRAAYRQIYGFVLRTDWRNGLAEKFWDLQATAGVDRYEGPTLGDTTTPMKTLEHAIELESTIALALFEQFTGERPKLPRLRLVKA